MSRTMAKNSLHLHLLYVSNHMLKLVKGAVNVEKVTNSRNDNEYRIFCKVLVQFKVIKSHVMQTQFVVVSHSASFFDVTNPHHVSFCRCGLMLQILYPS